jgi:hypothetical protein
MVAEQCEDSAVERSVVFIVVDVSLFVVVVVVVLVVVLVAVLDVHDFCTYSATYSQT